MIGSPAGGCQCNPSVLDPPGQGILRVYVRLADDPIAQDLASFHLEASRVDVVIGDPVTGEEALFTVANEPREADIPRSAAGIPLLVFAGLVPAGEIHQVRLVVDEASLTTQDRHTDQTLKVPSGAESGLKLVVRDAPVLEDGGTLANRR